MIVVFILLVERCEVDTCLNSFINFVNYKFNFYIKIDNPKRISYIIGNHRLLEED